jgi:TolB protein
VAALTVVETGKVKITSMIGLWLRTSILLTLFSIGLLMIAKFSGQGTEKHVIAYLLRIDSESTLRVMDIARSLDFVPIRQPVAQFAWSPNGRQLAFSTLKLNKFVIHILDWQSGEVRQFADTSRPSVLAWSPDASQLAFFSATDLYVGDIQTQTVKQIASSVNPAQYDNISWSSDGKTIAFSSDGNIEIIQADGSHLNTVKIEAANSYAPVFSRSGEQIAFDAYASEEDVHSIYVMDRNTRNRRRLFSEQEAFSPAWSPDGQQIAYLSLSPRSDSFIGIVDVEVGTHHQLTSLSGSTFTPVWSPDGRFIVFETISDEHRGIFQIYVINADGSNRRRLTFNINHTLLPAWQP